MKSIQKSILQVASVPVCRSRSLTADRLDLPAVRLTRLGRTPVARGDGDISSLRSRSFMTAASAALTGTTATSVVALNAASGTHLSSLHSHSHSHRWLASTSQSQPQSLSPPGRPLLPPLQVFTLGDDFPPIAANNTFKFSEEFTTQVSARLGLSLEATSKLKSLRVAPDMLLSMDDVKDTMMCLGIAGIDALKLATWLKRENKFRIEETKRRRSLEKEQKRKCIYIWDPNVGEFREVIFDDASQFRDFLVVVGTPYLNRVAAQNPSASESNDRLSFIHSMFDRLTNHAYYVYNKTTSSAAKVQDDIKSSIRKKVEFGYSNALKAHHGHERSAVFIGSDIILTIANQQLGDVGALFSSRNSASGRKNVSYYLLERKTTVSMESVAKLIQQLNTTKAAFLECLQTDPMFRAKHNLDDPMNVEVIVEQCVFYEMGSDDVAEFLVQRGISVLTPSCEYRRGVAAEAIAAGHAI